MIGKVYISHAPEEERLAQELAQALWRVGLESFASLHRQPAMISRAERVAFGMRNSECFIPILTVHGSVSRTVNQEVGLARGLDRLIIPLQEEGSEMPFLISHLQPIIFYSEVHDSYQDAIGKLIETLRDLTRLEWLKVICPSCGEEMTQYLTPQEEVDRSLMHGSFLETICSYCERPISLDPRTFKALP